MKQPGIGFSVRDRGDWGGGPIWTALLTLLVCLVWAGVPGPAGAAGVLSISPDQTDYRLSPYLEILRDPTQDLTIDQAASPELAGKFRPLKTESLSLGMVTDAIWLRFTVQSPVRPRNERPSLTQWLLYLGQPTLMSTAFYARQTGPGAEAPGAWQRQTALSRFLNPTASLGRFMVYRLPLEVGKRGVFYMRLTARGGVLLAPQVLSLEAYHRKSTTQMVVLFGYTGVILALAVYNLFLFFSIRDRSYLWYVFNVAPMAVYFLGFNGIYQDFSSPTWQALGTNIPIYGMAMGYVFRGLFARSFLMTKITAPVLDKVVLVYALVIGVSAFCISLPQWGNAAAKITSLLGLGWPFLGLMAGIVCWVRGFKPAKYFLPAYFMASMGGLIFILTLNGVIPFTDWNFQVQPIGYSIEAVLLSLALGFRVRSLRDAKVGAEKALIVRGRQLRRLAIQLTAAEERQRRIIAEDLHDSVTQNLATSLFSLRLLKKSAVGTEQEKEMERICGLLDQTLGETRSLTFDISPPVLYDHGLAAALKWLSMRFLVLHGLEVKYIEKDRPRGLEENIKVTLFRAAQELLVNVVKHSGTKKARLSIETEGSRVVIQVSDQGRGFDPAESTDGDHHGFGLFSIRERLELLGGRIDIGSRPGGGARVAISAPLGDSREAPETTGLP